MGRHAALSHRKMWEPGRTNRLGRRQLREHTRTRMFGTIGLYAPPWGSLFMTHNVGSIDKGLRMAAGLMLLGLGVFTPLGWWVGADRHVRQQVQQR